MPPQMQRGQSTGENTRKALRAELDAQQVRTFQRWWNSWLSEVKLSIKDLCEDVKPGVYPIRLLEVLSNSSCGKVMATHAAALPRATPPREP